MADDPKTGNKEHKNEIYRTELISVLNLWRECKGQAAGANQTEATAIDDEFKRLLETEKDKVDWLALNDLELRVGKYLTFPQLIHEYDALLVLARRRNLQEYDSFAAKKGLGDAAAASVADQAAHAADVAKFRAAYQTLLVQLQGDFVDARARRGRRFEFAARLLKYGYMILGVALAAIVVSLVYLVYLDTTASDEKSPSRWLKHGFVFIEVLVAACLGLLGALFGRAFTFQTEPGRGYDEDMRQYARDHLKLRLMVGVISAGVFYFLMKGGLVQGLLFPNYDGILSAAGGETAGGKGAPAAGTAVTQLGNWAKLVVWSFIAGYSERLLPDSLERTVSRSEKSE